MRLVGVFVVFCLAILASSMPIHRPRLAFIPIRPILLLQNGVRRPLAVFQKRSMSFDADRNHAQTIEQQNRILELGQQFSLDITNGLVSPIVTINNGISKAASALPSVLAANGALLGTVLATPVQAGTILANDVAAGVAGTLVSIPISLASGATAQLIGVIETGRQLYNVKLGAIQDYLYKKAPFLLRPMTVLKGSGAVLGGSALSGLGSAATQASEKFSNLGSGLSTAGKQMQNLGQSVLTFSLQDELPIHAIADTVGPMNSVVSVEPLSSAPLAEAEDSDAPNSQAVGSAGNAEAAVHPETSFESVSSVHSLETDHPVEAVHSDGHLEADQIIDPHSIQPAQPLHSDDIDHSGPTHPVGFMDHIGGEAMEHSFEPIDIQAKVAEPFAVNTEPIVDDETTTPSTGNEQMSEETSTDIDSQIIYSSSTQNIDRVLPVSEVQGPSSFSTTPVVS